MYLIGLLIVFVLASYIYHFYLPYFVDFNENVFLLLICIFYSVLYLSFNYSAF
jgi:hypothetical protein